MKLPLVLSDDLSYLFAVSSAASTPVSHRIALVSGNACRGGSTTFLINFAGELVRRGIPVEVCSLERENDMAADFQKKGIPLSCQDQHRMIFEDRLTAVLGKLARFRPTTLIATLGSVSFETLRYAPPGVFRAGVGQSDDRIVYEMMAHYTGVMDLVAMVSSTMKSKTEAMPEFKGKSIAWLPYGVPMCPDDELPARDFQRPLRILYLGRICQEQKRVRLFPEIYAQLCASGIPFHWTIAGEGEDRAFLEEALKSATPAQRVSFPGAIAYQDVPGVLQAHDIMLLASDYEGLPLSLLEAMGAGMVPVVSDLPSGIPEVVNAATGCLVKVSDIPGYARAIIHLHHHRDELAAKSAAAREKVKRDFSVAAMTDRWLAQLPANPPTVSWEKRSRIKIPLITSKPYYFSPPVRILRRLAARWRK